MLLLTYQIKDNLKLLILKKHILLSHLSQITSAFISIEKTQLFISLKQKATTRTSSFKNNVDSSYILIFKISPINAKLLLKYFIGKTLLDSDSI